MKTVAISTLGCKVNQAESQNILDAMRQKGWRPVGFDQPASVYIVNTCTVTGTADQKSRKLIRSAKKHNPGALLVVTGCYAESGHGKLEGFGEIDLVLGNGQKEALPDLVENAWLQKAGARAEAEDAAYHVGRLHGVDRTRAMLKIQDGCRQFCTYCVIPYVRRNWYSMPAEEVLESAGKLAAAGFKEIVLLGIHLGVYGSTGGGLVSANDSMSGNAGGVANASTNSENSGLCGEDGLAHILEALLLAYPRVRFRLGSVEPMEATEKLLSVISAYPNACKHLHLPLQSGSDVILRRMGRPYSTEAYRQKVNAILRRMPGIALTTDIITGFPGEGDAEHRESLAFAEEMAFSRLHVFPYTSRPGTLAADMPGQVAKSVKEARSRDFISLGRRMQECYGAGQTGRVQQVLVEECLGGGNWTGHCDNYMEMTFTVPAGFPGTAQTDDIRGMIFPVKITGKSLLKAEAWQGELL